MIMLIELFCILLLKRVVIYKSITNLIITSKFRIRKTIYCYILYPVKTRRKKRNKSLTDSRLFIKVPNRFGLDRVVIKFINVTTNTTLIILVCGNTANRKVSTFSPMYSSSAFAICCRENLFVHFTLHLPVNAKGLVSFGIGFLIRRERDIFQVSC